MKNSSLLSWVAVAALLAGCNNSPDYSTANVNPQPNNNPNAPVQGFPGGMPSSENGTPMSGPPGSPFGSMQNQVVESTKHREIEAGGKISFTKNVAPILLQKCGGCHVNRSQGQLSFASFAGIQKGSENGPVFYAEKPDDSTLVTSVENGEMPPRSPKIHDEDIKILRDWVAQGAKFDGDSDQTTLVSMAPDIKIGGGMGGGPRGGFGPGGPGGPGGFGPGGFGPGGPGGGPGGPGPGGFGNFDPAARFKERDANSDGKLTGDEISERMMQNLEAIDTDKDGGITLEEFQTSMQRFFGGQGGGGFGPPGGGPGGFGPPGGAPGGPGGPGGFGPGGFQGPPRPSTGQQRPPLEEESGSDGAEKK